MTLLSKVLRPRFDADHWHAIIPAVRESYEGYRVRWFDECVWALEDGLRVDGTSRSILRNTLSGPAAFATAGYQLSFTGNLLAQHQYVARDKTESFLGLLSKDLCAADRGAVLGYVHRYEEAKDDDSTRRFRMGVDIGGYIVGDHANMIVLLHAAALVERLETYTHLAIASAFEDFATIKRLCRKHQIAV